MKLCIRSHDIGEKNIDRLLQRLVEYNLDGLQLVCYKTFEDISYKAGQLTGEKAGEIGSKITESGKKVYLTGAYFNPVHSNFEKTALGIKIFKEYLSLHKELGCDIVGSETGSYNDDKWTYHPNNRTETALRIVTDTFAELCAYAKDKAAYVGIEGAAGHVCYNVTTLKKAVDAIGMDNLKIIFDIYNFLDRDNHNEYISILESGINTFGDRIHCFHLKDYDIADNAIRQVAIGEGRIDYKKLLSIIKQHNKNAILILEGTTGKDIVPSVRNIKYLWENI